MLLTLETVYVQGFFCIWFAMLVGHSILFLLIFHFLSSMGSNYGFRPIPKTIPHNTHIIGLYRLRNHLATFMPLLLPLLLLLLLLLAPPPPPLLLQPPLPPPLLPLPLPLPLLLLLLLLLLLY